MVVPVIACIEFARYKRLVVVEQAKRDAAMQSENLDDTVAALERLRTLSDLMTAHLRECRVCSKRA